MHILTTIETYYLWLMIYSCIGWIYESILCSVAQKKWINRGFLNGPYCPIYGSGAVLVILILGRIQNPVLLFFLGALVCCTLEYLTSYCMEKLFHARWWDYSKRKCNLNGRICLIGAVVFGAFSVALVLGLHPLVRSVTDRIPPLWMHILCAALLCIFVTDLGITLRSLASFHTKMQELGAYLEREREAAKDKWQESDAYQNAVQVRSALKERLNLQQRRVLRAFPTLHFKAPDREKTLQRLRDAAAKIRETEKTLRAAAKHKTNKN